jgi:hypothetical protein
MERIGKQKQARNQLILFRSQHAGLAATIGMAAQIDAFRNRSLEEANSLAEAGTVGGRVPREWRTLRAVLAERKIAPQSSESCLGKSVGQRRKQFRMRIRAGPVRQHDAVAILIVRDVKKPADRRIGGSFADFSNRDRGGHDTILRGSTHFSPAGLSGPGFLWLETLETS